MRWIIWVLIRLISSVFKFWKILITASGSRSPDVDVDINTHNSAVVDWLRESKTKSFRRWVFLCNRTSIDSFIVPNNKKTYNKWAFFTVAKSCYYRSDFEHRAAFYLLRTSCTFNGLQEEFCPAHAVHHQNRIADGPSRIEAFTLEFSRCGL